MFTRGSVVVLLVCVIVFITFSLASFLHGYILVPFFVNPAEKFVSLFVNPWMKGFWSYFLGITMMALSISALGWLSSIQVLSRITKRHPFVLKIPVVGKSVGMLIKVFEFEWKTESKFKYIIETEDDLYGIRGKWPGLVTNEYERDGIVYCTVYIPSAMSIWTGYAKREVRRADLTRIIGATVLDFVIFVSTFGANDPFLGKSREKLN